MAKLNLGTKIENGGTSANGKVTATEINAIQASINAIYDHLFTNGIIGSIKKEALLEGNLSRNQFEDLPNGDIGIKTSYLQSLGLGGGGTGPIKLATPAPTATVISTTQINLNCPVVPNASGYTWERATNSNFTDAVVISAGSSPSYNNTGLAQSTTYYYRVKATTTNSAYTESNYAGTSGTTQGSGLTTPAAPTGFIVDDINNTGDFTFTVGITSLSDYETTSDSGLAQSQLTVKPFIVGDVAKSPGQVGIRVKAIAGTRNASAWLFNQQPFTSTGGGTYVVERTFRINFANVYGATPPDGAPYWNTFNPPNSVLQTINGFTSPLFIDSDGLESNLTLKNSGAFGGSTPEVSNPQLGVDGVFTTTVVNSAWSVSGTTNAKILITGLNPIKYYQLYFLMPVSGPPSVRGISIAGLAKNKTATTGVASFGTPGNGLSDPELIVYNNITGSSVEVGVNRISGDFGAFIACMVIEESNIAK